MMEIQVFGQILDSTLLFQVVMPILSIIVIVFAYLNYRKKPVLKTETSPSANNSSGVVQQNADNMNIENQTIIIADEINESIKLND